MGDAFVPEVSALIPCLNEEENISLISEAVISELNKLSATYEIIFIDNGSSDDTINIIKSICAKNPNVKLICNNKNYGQMKSPTYGIYQTRGRVVLGISSDFQDPPELIGEMITRWRGGTPIVLGVRRAEKMSFLMSVMRGVGYWFFARFAEYRVIPGATGFGVYDRRVVDHLSKWRDSEPFFRGMLVESGFDIETIPYDRPQRAGGRSKNNVWTILSFGIASLASSSKNLLRVPIYLSFITALLASATFFAAIISAILGSGFVWLLIAGIFQLAFALILFFMGLIGEQVRVISGMVRNQPLVIERERVNFSD